MRKFSEQSGRSMVEMLGVLAIIGVLSVAGIAGYSRAMAKYKTTRTLDQVSMLVANIRTIYAGQRNYTDLTAAVAVGIGAVPSEMVQGSGTTATIVNAYNGAVTLGTSSVDGITDRGFWLSYAGLDSETCATLLTSDWGSGNSSGLIAMSIAAPTNAAAVPESTTASTGPWVTKDLPVSPANASTACLITGDNTTTSVTWYYY